MTRLSKNKERHFRHDHQSNRSYIQITLLTFFALLVLLFPSVIISPSAHATKEPIYSSDEEFNGDIRSLVISSDGKYFAGMNENYFKFFRRTNDGAERLWAFDEGHSRSSKLAISDDGAYLVAGCENRQLYFFMTETNDPVWNYSFDERIFHVRMSGDGKIISVSSRKSVFVFRNDRNTPYLKLNFNEGVTSLELTHDGKYMAIGDKTNHLYFFKTDNSTPIWNFSAEDDFYSLDISNDGSYIAAGNDNNKLYFFNKDSSTPLWNYSTNDTITTVVISDDGSYIVFGSIDYSVNLLGSNGTLIWNFTAGDRIYSLAISSRAGYIAAGSAYRDSNIYFFNRNSSTPIWNYSSKRGIGVLAISKDGKYLVSDAYQFKILLFKNDISGTNGENNGDDDTIMDHLLEPYGPLPLVGYAGIVAAISIVGAAGVKRKRSRKKTVAQPFPSLQPPPQIQQPQPDQPFPPPQPQYPPAQPPLMPGVPQQPYGSTQQFPQVQMQQFPTQQFNQPFPPAQMQPTPIPQPTQPAVPSPGPPGRATWTCPKCGNRVEQRFIFCTECGFRKNG